MASVTNNILSPLNSLFFFFFIRNKILLIERNSNITSSQCRRDPHINSNISILIHDNNSFHFEDATLNNPHLSILLLMWVCGCVCVCVRERERGIPAEGSRQGNIQPYFQQNSSAERTKNME